MHNSKSSKKDEECMVSFGRYGGHEYRSPDATVGEGKCLVESKWMKVMQHTVRQDGGEGKDADLIPDWLWIDYHDRINVLVQDPNSDLGNFLVFRQTKYALEGKDSLAIVGGIIEPGEDPKQAAQREVEEELAGLQCLHFHFLGRFRTDVNRGMGWVNSFLAMDCHRYQHDSLASNKLQPEQIGDADSERQDVLSISLSQLHLSLREGKFLEVQWSNTVSLALMNLELYTT